MTGSLHELPQHEHTFGQDLPKRGERRTWIVIAITGTMMALEIAAGVMFGSMALLADGLHMASHAVALAINAVAYAYARRHARDVRFSFGTGKVNALGGFTGAILLAGFALLMAYESFERILDPVEIQFINAIVVAVLGLLVNAACVFILGGHHSHHSRKHDEQHNDDHEGRGHDHHAEGDHNLKAAYFHVLADAITSFTAIFALLGGRFLGAAWLDPVMGVVGSILVGRWSFGLLRDTSKVLLDRQADENLRERVRAAIEQRDADTVSDLHLWSIGPNIFNLNVTVISEHPLSADEYKRRVPEDLGIVHSTVEVHHVRGR